MPEDAIPKLHLLYRSGKLHNAMPKLRLSRRSRRRDGEQGFSPESPDEQVAFITLEPESEKRGNSKAFQTDSPD